MTKGVGYVVVVQWHNTAFYGYDVNGQITCTYTYIYIYIYILKNRDVLLRDVPPAFLETKWGSL